MITPKLAHDALLQDIRNSSAEDHFSVWWLGQSGFLIKWQNSFLLFDPYLSDSLTRKYADTDKPHVRMTELAIDPNRLDFVDVVTSSHNHTDHLDGETLTALRSANPSLQIVVPAANQQFAADRLEVEASCLLPIDAGQSRRVGPFELLAVPAAHETVERDEEGRCKFIGLIAKFGSWTVYHSGDTMLFDGIEDVLKPHGIDLALLPINGRAPERRVAGNLWGREAAELAANVGAQVVIPCHYDMFEFNTATPVEFVDVCHKLGQRHQVLECGESWSSALLAQR